MAKSIKVASIESALAYKKMTEKKTIAYIEFGSTGHRPLWIRSVTDAFQKYDNNCQFDVWVPKEFIKLHYDWCKPYLSYKETAEGNIRFRLHEEIITPNRGRTRMKLEKFDVIQRCVEADNADVCFVANNLDACVKSIAFSRPANFHAKIVGVMDQPHLHYRKFYSRKTKRWLSLRKYISSYIKNYFMCHRSYVAEVLMLDHLAPEYYNRVLFTSKCQYLPEFVYHVDSFPQPRRSFGLPKDRYVFSLLGTMSRRKGVMEFLSGLEIVFDEHPNLRKKIAIVFAGIVISEFREKFYRKISAIRLQYPDTPLFVFDRFLADREFISLISCSDVICMPYLNFIGTSGILMNAAAHGRPVLASEFGFLGEIVRRYELGETCDESNNAEVAIAIHKLIEESRHPKNYKSERIKSFAKIFSVSLKKFGEAVWKSLLRSAER